MTQTNLQERGAARGARRAHETAVPCRVQRWELVASAASGSLAAVYRARPAGATDRPAAYALKMLHARWRNDPRAVRLLAREAHVGRIVSHPNVIPVLAARVSQTPRFVVMPWLEGDTLQTHLAAGRRFDLPEALWFMRQAAEGLDALHRAGWMHGDLKPGNLFLSPEGHVTLLDLGFARGPDETGSAVDRCVLGTCNYLAPEWITSSLRADIRSDIYSLGVVLFEILSGRVPFAGRNLAEVATQHRQAIAPNLQRLVPHVPGDVADLVRRMLAKDPLRRPQTPREIIELFAAMEIATFSERVWA
jgi:eukaryotic-like serine/threonine-protein kinase